MFTEREKKQALAFLRAVFYDVSYELGNSKTPDTLLAFKHFNRQDIGFGIVCHINPAREERVFQVVKTRVTRAKYVVIDYRFPTWSDSLADATAQVARQELEAKLKGNMDCWQRKYV